MPPNDVSNNSLGKKISVEVLISMVLMLVAVVGSYSVLADDQKEQSEEIASIKEAQAQTRHAVQSIETDVAVIRNEQQHFKEDMEEQKADIRAIRDILEKAFSSE